MPKFSYNDIVAVGGGGTVRRAWIVGISEDRLRFPLPMFADGVVYTVEFEDGSSVMIHEDDLAVYPKR